MGKWKPEWQTGTYRGALHFSLCHSFELRHSDFVISPMYKHILIPLENSSADETILSHIRRLARVAGAKLLLVHVADGWVARNFNQLQLAESEEMKEDRAYLEKRVHELTAEGFSCDAVLALGEPSDEIIKLAREKNVDLVAMTTHGHRFVSDILYGATVDKVRHEVEVPVLLLKVQS
jgi:nucleotide-binding universal stress UspA family protein